MFMNQFWIYGKVQVCLWTSSGSMEKFRYVYEPVLDLWKSSGMFMKQFWIYEKFRHVYEIYHYCCQQNLYIKFIICALTANWYRICLGWKGLLIRTSPCADFYCLGIFSW
jgi:hypothetical protein